VTSDGHDMTPPIPSSSEVLLGVRIDRICEEFESLLKTGKAPRIETYLAELPEDHQSTLLEELLGLELDYRSKAGDSFTSDEYTLRFPEHASSVADLVQSVRGQHLANGRTQDSKPRQTPTARNASGSSQTTPRSSGSGEPVRIGPYEIIEPCGRGGMGVVYKAWHELFKQYRAIKVLPSNFDDEDISRFSMEIELAGRLNHPHIVRAHEANREQGILYLVMEFVDGINLDHLVKHHNRLPVGLACEMIRQAAEGLQHAHEHFLVHRDIKPSNLMVNQQGQIKILDFGLARLHAEQNASRLTKHGSVMGTLDFMAPEQWEDPMGATIQADIYSLGCTL
jgi:serine/threonine protein kinase